MAMQVGNSGGEQAPLNSINTTPLVDIMLVLLIIFLITSPVVLHLIKIKLPEEANQVIQTKPEDVNIVVSKDGDIYWNQRKMRDANELFDNLKVEAVKLPQPEVHIRGDKGVRFEAVGRVILACQKAGIQKVGFITEPHALDETDE